jgi:hypothetical protein
MDSAISKETDILGKSVINRIGIVVLLMSSPGQKIRQEC